MAYTACKTMDCDLAGVDLKVSLSENTTPYWYKISKRSHFVMIPKLQWSFFFTIVSNITLNACWRACTGCQETTHQTLALMSLWWPVNSPNTGPVLRKTYQCQEVITKPIIYGNFAHSKFNIGVHVMHKTSGFCIRFRIRCYFHFAIEKNSDWLLIKLDFPNSTRATN